MKKTKTNLFNLLNAVGLSTLFILTSCNVNGIDETSTEITNNQLASKSLKLSESDKEYVKSKLEKIKNFTIKYKPEIQKSDVDPYSLAEEYLKKEGIPIPQLQEYHYELRDRGFKDPLNFLKDKGIISDIQISILEEFAKDLSSSEMEIDDALKNLDDIIANSKLRNDEKVKLENFSIIMKVLRDSNPEIFSLTDPTARRRMTVGCALGLVGIGVAFVGLTFATGGTVTAAAVASGGYVFSCVTAAIGCSSLGDHPL